MNILITVIIFLALGAVLFFVSGYFWAKSVPQPGNVGTGELAPCPKSPNCVSTLDDDEYHGMEPIPYTGTREETKQKLLAFIATLPKAEVIADKGDYVHVLTRSPMMGFPDDVEFVFDDAEKVIRFRSAARMGKGDLGKNRERMEQIKNALL